MARRYWLLKSAPTTYSIEDLERDGSTEWDGVRNYRARNFLRDDMKVGDLVLYHHSSAKPPGVAGIAKVCREGYPDHTAFEKKSSYFDPNSDPEDPRWIMVDVEFVEKFHEVVSLDTMKNDPKLEGMLVIRRGQRLSVMPVEKAHFDHVVKLGRGR